MHTFSSTMPRLFGRAPTPTPAAASASVSAPGPAPAPSPATAAAHAAPPRAKLVRKSHMNLASSPAPLASRRSLASRASLGSLGSMGSMGSVPAMPPLSPSSSLSFGLTTGQSPGQGLPLLETHREGSFVSTSAASAYEGLLNEYDRSSLYSIGSGQHPHPHPHAHPHPHPRVQNTARHSHYTIRSQRNVHRAWLSAADARQSSWSGERPPPRKLVKDPNGSARPTASRELVDEDDLRHRVTGNGSNSNNDIGNDHTAQYKASTPATLGIRRKMARWRDLRW